MAAGTSIRSINPGLSYPVGMTWDGRSLWVNIGGPISYQIDPVTGTVIRSITSTGLATDSDDLAHDGRSLWKMFSTSEKVYQIDPVTGAPIRSIPIPDTPLYGVAFDGRSLWLAGGNPNMIYQVDPATGTVLKSFSGPAAYCRGLEYHGGRLWLAGGNYFIIYEIDPATGTVIRSFSSPISTTCMAFVDCALWVAGRTTVIHLISIS